MLDFVYIYKHQVTRGYFMVAAVCKCLQNLYYQPVSQKLVLVTNLEGCTLILANPLSTETDILQVT